MIYLYLVFNYDLLWPFLYLSWLLRRTRAVLSVGNVDRIDPKSWGGCDGSPTCIEVCVPAICPTRPIFLLNSKEFSLAA